MRAPIEASRPTLPSPGARVLYEFETTSGELERRSALHRFRLAFEALKLAVICGVPFAFFAHPEWSASIGLAPSTALLLFALGCTYPVLLAVLWVIRRRLAQIPIGVRVTEEGLFVRSLGRFIPFREISQVLWTRHLVLIDRGQDLEAVVTAEFGPGDEAFQEIERRAFVRRGTIADLSLYIRTRRRLEIDARKAQEAAARRAGV